MPLKTRDGVADAPIEPGARTVCEPVLAEDLRHPALLSQHPGHQTSWIWMSTPAGRWSSRWSESTVFGVGCRMSISRLCVRISKCSRESLSLKGLRITQYTFFSVGS